MDESATFIDEFKEKETKITIDREMELDEISSKAENGRHNGIKSTSFDKVSRI